MDIQIRELEHLEQARSIEMDSSFIIDSILDLTINGGQIEYKVNELADYRKSYEEISAGDYEEYIGNPNRKCYLAYAGEIIVGQILLKKHWNKYGFVDYLKIDNKYRGYESCGFVIGGFDDLLYKGLHPQTNEAAIYWYLMFE